MVGIFFWISILFIFYVYIGYPLLIGFLALFKKEIIYELTDLPKVTLIFAAFNEEKIIAKKIENSLALDYPKELFQILVADDGSTDQTTQIIKEYESKGVEILSFRQRRGKLAAIKDAVKNAKGEIIIFSDADNFYQPNMLYEMLKYFSDPQVGAVSGGRNVIGTSNLGTSESLYWKYEELIKKFESRIGNCIGVAGDLLAIRKNLYNSPPSGIINDDVYIAFSILKQDFRVVYAPNARSYHPVAESFQQEVERRTRMVAGRYQTIFSAWDILPYQNPVAIWQIMSHKYFRPLIPMFMIAAFVANGLTLFSESQVNGPEWLVLKNPYNWVFFLIQILFYGISFVSSKFEFGGWLGKAIYIPTFLVNSNYAALQGLYRYIFSKQTVYWKKSTR